MSTVVISHEYASSPDQAWYEHLAATLDAHDVRTPQMPDPEAPQPEPWLRAVAEQITDPADTVLVGHSLGGVNLLRLLQRHEGEPFAGVVLVAAMAHEVGYDQLAAFFEDGFDWARIRNAAKQFRVLAAIDDPVLTPDPLDHVRLFTTHLGAKSIVTADGIHFSRHQNRRELREAIDLVTELLP
ncbi:alpha/beta fold hydrolase [Nocardia huaxiensis]|uniref:Alpha/beta fold hydrolase n=1 Tax=Nocardia huaxiensis TaxID=2755382 RepID=A0A7D6Z1B7_9NOCA|nr:alpha/beta fold hydrolase [Nocardia huaxiensis]QLY30086.1 alpha/beta fold hydrolase [Nocardia huaxiensis]